MNNLTGRITGLVLVASMLFYAGCDQPTEVTTQNEQATPQQVQAPIDQPIDGQYIVAVEGHWTGTQAERATQTEAVIQDLTREYSIQAENLLQEYTYSFRGFSAELSDKQLGLMRKDPRIKYIEQDRMISLAPPNSCTPWPSCKDDSGGGGGGSSQTTPWGIIRVGGPVASNGTAWVIDSGIDLDHPDLNVDVNRSATMISRGKDSKSADDLNGHGTHVAGTIAAIDNDIDVVGVAAGASVVAVKVLDQRGSGSYSDVIAGIDYVAQNASAGDVANMSLGGSPSDAVDDAVRNAADQGIFFAIAAGNSGADANNYSPARVEHGNVWTISASDDADVFASFSNYSGPTDPPVEFAAPGVEILSLYLDGGTSALNGTSMASPHAAGILLVTGGNPTSDGLVSADPDGDEDPIIHN